MYSARKPNLVGLFAFLISLLAGIILGFLFEPEYRMKRQGPPEDPEAQD